MFFGPFPDRMRIVLYSRFYPNIGGIETLAWLLVREWQRNGCDVTVLTDVAQPAPGCPPPLCEVLYRPKPLAYLRLHLNSDLGVHMNVGLRALWPSLLFPRPWVAVHHGTYGGGEVSFRNWRATLKLTMARRAKANIAVSQAVARCLPVECHVIPNGYDDLLFTNKGAGTRSCELAFVGRLVSEKGADLLLIALAGLRQASLTPRLTIIGDGPERLNLEKMCVNLQLEDQVKFAGNLSPALVAAELRRHQILVVPSVYEEPFGIVALEGAASGCVILGSDGGGLPEAIGPAGLTFRRGDTLDLSQKLRKLLTDPEPCKKCLDAAPAHLASHRFQGVAERYLGVFRQVLASAGRQPGNALKRSCISQ